MPLPRSLSALLLLTLGLPACQPGQTQPIQPTPLPQEEHIQVFTNHEPAASYTEPYRGQTRSGDDLEQIIVDTIHSARSSIDVAVQEFRLPKIAQALVDRQRAGVTVRVILENNYSRPLSQFTEAEVAKLDAHEKSRYAEFRQLVDRDHDGTLSADEIAQGDALVMLDAAQIPRIDDTADGSAGSNLMHHKFLVVDHQTVIVTSSNWTTSDAHGDFKSPSSQGNANNLLKIDSSELATLFSQEFGIMWGDGPGGQKNSRFGVKKPFRPAQRVMVGSVPIEVQFSPTSKSVPWEQSSNGLISKTLSEAKSAIELALFVLSDQQLVDRLEPVQQNGVDLRVLIEPSFAYRSYSEGLDMLGIQLADDNCRYEPSNHLWQTPLSTVGVPRLPPGDLLHHKFGIVDHKTVITGSHNWTDAANTGNDETLLVVHSSIVAAHYLREFDRLYTDAILGIPSAIQKKASAQAKQCRQPQSRLAAASELAPSELVAATKQVNKPSSTKLPRSHASHQPSTAAQTPQSHASHQPSTAAQTSVAQTSINLNTADQATLETLPGVGPGLAKRIIAARQQHPFRSLSDLDRVAGVGPKLLRRLENRVTW